MRNNPLYSEMNRAQQRNFDRIVGQMGSVRLQYVAEAKRLCREEGLLNALEYVRKLRDYYREVI